MRQLTLLGLVPVAADESTPADTPAADLAADPGVPAGQAELFADQVVLVREVELAIGRGDFEEAARVRGALEETYGPRRDRPDATELGALARLPWREAGQAFDAAEAIAASLRDLPLACLRRGILVRLLREHAAETLARERPAALPRLVALLVGRSASDDAPILARCLVRDALLAGEILEPLDFACDEPVQALLGEDMTPPWLACLGAIRRVWPAPPLAADEIEVAARAAQTAGDDGGAHEFWQWLRVADTPECPEPALLEARRRLKALHSGLHAIFMRRSRPRIG